jgi:outer membrane protein OmpA-like peptidoglycan-associated protein
MSNQQSKQQKAVSLTPEEYGELKEIIDAQKASIEFLNTKAQEQSSQYQKILEDLNEKLEAVKEGGEIHVRSV